MRRTNRHAPPAAARRRPARRILLTALLAGTLLAGAGCKKSDPVYKGKKCSEWIHQLMAPDSGLRYEAISACVALGPAAADAVPRLMSLMQYDKDGRIRAHAAEALAKIGDEAVEPLTDVLEDATNKYDRILATQTLGDMGPPGAKGVKALIGALGKDADGDVRAAAAMALGHLGRIAQGPAAVQALAGALKDKVYNVRFRSVSVLAQYGAGAAGATDALVAALRDEKKAVAAKAIETLTKIGPPAIGALSACLRGDHNVARHRAAVVLARLGDPALPALKAAFRDADESVRIAAAVALRGRGADGLPIYVEMLDDPKAEVRDLASNLIVPFGRDAIGLLVPALKDANDRRRAAAKQIILEIGASALPQLEQAAKDAEYKGLVEPLIEQIKKKRKGQ